MVSAGIPGSAMGDWRRALESNQCISRYDLHGSPLRGTVFYDEIISSAICLVLTQRPSPLLNVYCFLYFCCDS